MTWQIELVGEPMDIDELRELAPSAGCAIGIGADGRHCLMGAQFDALPGYQEVRALGSKTLTVLNTIARLRYADHRPVQTGHALLRVHPDGRRDVAVAVPPIEGRGRVSVGTTVIRADGTTDETATADPDKNAERYRRILADPKLFDIAEALAGNITWQRLRVEFERITALVGKSGQDVHALVKLKYAQQTEIDQFKANVEDPRISGIDAVHLTHPLISVGHKRIGPILDLIIVAGMQRIEPRCRN